MTKHSEFVVRMEKQMTRWDKEVAELAALGNKTTDDMKVSFLSAMMAMRAARENAEKTFQEARFAGEANGDRMRAVMQDAWVTMQQELAKANAGLKK
jgi:hypothetical protein